MKSIMNFFKDETGIALAEYAFLLALITIALILVITQFRGAITEAFVETTDTMNPN